ncbi:hypothetical protein T05_6416 [Trichinella murrelli]|uniref:Uncharacterized protein n=1 Tax=Trichinella murrelli TaxID=144512 RepID=A0A0V0U8S3_9BILA|nr:hypothetical protein T05_8344 [Trichinella murrelli]KRX47657.1 hypothetical protein T05_6416 [Trichinella murrelli]
MECILLQSFPKIIFAPNHVTSCSAVRRSIHPHHLLCREFIINNGIQEIIQNGYITNVQQTGTRTSYIYSDAHHTAPFTTLTSFSLPPVALQKGKRDAQVQFRGRRHTAPSFREVRPELSLRDVIPQVAGWPPSSRRPSYLHL